MLCLSDSDFIIKLAEFDLLNEAIKALGFSRSDVRVLPELRRVLAGQSIYRRQTRECVERASKFIKGLKTIEQIDRTDHAILTAARATYKDRDVTIEGGEAVI